MIEIKDKSMCSGCTACKSICPKNAITMEHDEEGFLYPKVDKEKCINCGLCDKVCPILNKKEEKECEQKAYLVNNKNDDIRNESTSGGAFTPFAEYIINQGGVVFGVTFDEEFQVVHKYVDNVKDLQQFRGSKYVQSNLNDAFKEVEGFLKADKKVLFSGTPCQIEGLKSYLKKEYDNLLTIDMVCHAVPSPLVWKKYLEMQKRKLKGDKIEKVLFRDKSKYGYKYSTMTIKTDKDLYQMGVETDPYLRAFFGDLSDRPSCYNCQFKKQYRMSDITVWDCFTVESFDKNLDDDRGTTRVLIHSDNGIKLFEDVRENFRYIEVEPKDLVKNVKEMYHSVSMNTNREQFFKDINNMEEDAFFEKYFPDTIKVKLERRTRRILARTGIYKNIKKYVKKILRK